LSTGKRINSAADDAAGLAIGARMSSQITGLTQAARNANDGVSMIQTAEAAYVEVGDMLQRMREIAVQSASETYANSDRTALDLEWQALADEIERISAQTTWNGFTLLDGSPGTVGSVKIQSGANASQTVDVDFGKLSAKAVTAAGINEIADSSGALVHNTANGDFKDTIVASAATNAAATHTVGITDYASLATGDVLVFTIQENDGSTKHQMAITLNATDVATVGSNATTAIGGTQVIEDGKTLANIVGSGTNTAGAVDFGIATIAGTSTAGEIIFTGTTAGTGGTAGNADFTILDMKVRRGHTSVLHAVDVSTQAKANAAITALDTAIQSVNSQRASYGSFISRLEHASDNLTSIATNTAQSRSRVVDANYATETTELARTQIIQQAATAMLAQANQMKQTVLALLQ
jgi:flagellin